MKKRAGVCKPPARTSGSIGRASSPINVLVGLLYGKNQRVELGMLVADV